MTVWPLRHEGTPPCQESCHFGLCTIPVRWVTPGATADILTALRAARVETGRAQAPYRALHGTALASAKSQGQGSGPVQAGMDVNPPSDAIPG